MLPPTTIPLAAPGSPGGYRESPEREVDKADYWDGKLLAKGERWHNPPHPSSRSEFRSSPICPPSHGHPGIPPAHPRRAEPTSSCLPLSGFGYRRDIHPWASKRQPASQLDQERKTQLSRTNERKALGRRSQ